MGRKLQFRSGGSCRYVQICNSRFALGWSVGVNGSKVDGSGKIHKHGHCNSLGSKSFELHLCIGLSRTAHRPTAHHLQQLLLSHSRSCAQISANLNAPWLIPILIHIQEETAEGTTKAGLGYLEHLKTSRDKRCVRRYSTHHRHIEVITDTEFPVAVGL